MRRLRDICTIIYCHRLGKKKAGGPSALFTCPDCLARKGSGFVSFFPTRQSPAQLSLQRGTNREQMHSKKVPAEQIVSDNPRQPMNTLQEKAEKQQRLYHNLIISE